MMEVLTQLVKLSIEAPVAVRYTLATLGIMLILAGWRAYRFWFGAGITLLAGIWGSVYGPAYGLSPILAGPLTAVGIGCIALALTRVLIFATAGWLCWQVGSLVLEAWANPLLCFLIGGILSTLVFHLVVRVITSGLGVAFLAMGLGWLNTSEDTVILAGLAKKMGVENAAWLWLGATLLATTLQVITDKGLDWWRARREQATKKAPENKNAKAHAA